LREVVSIGFRVILKDLEKRGNFVASKVDLVVFNDDKVFANFFGSIGGLDVDDEG
jgi:hypothetical protein